VKESIESIRADSKPCQCHRQNQPLISTSIGYDLLNGSHGETHISKDPPSSPLKRKSLHAHIDKEAKRTSLSKISAHDMTATPRKLSLRLSPAYREPKNPATSLWRHSPSTSSSHVHHYRPLAAETPTRVLIDQRQSFVAPLGTPRRSATLTQSHEIPLMKDMHHQDVLLRSLTTTHENATSHRESTMAADPGDLNCMSQNENHLINPKSNHVSDICSSRANTYKTSMPSTNKLLSTLSNRDPIPTPLLSDMHGKRNVSSFGITRRTHLLYLDVNPMSDTRLSTSPTPSKINSVIPFAYPPSPDKPLTIRQLRVTSTVSSMSTLHDDHNW
jgi:hypothetical protein